MRLSPRRLLAFTVIHRLGAVAGIHSVPPDFCAELIESGAKIGSVPSDFSCELIVIASV